jgi:hypothetical protein
MTIFRSKRYRSLQRQQTPGLVVNEEHNEYGEQLSDLMAPLLTKRAQGRDISGLSAYEY